MNQRTIFKGLTMCAGLAVSLHSASAASIAVGVGIRETGAAGAVGTDGGTGGSIEWADRGVHMVTDSGAWQTVSIDFSSAAVTAFTGDGALSAANDQGTLEHLAFDIVDSKGPFSVYIDNLVYTPLAGAATVIADWEGHADGTEVIFQEPTFSGSTAGRLVAGGGAGTVSGGLGNGSDGAYLLNFEWIDQDPTNWVRVTTFGTPNNPNPIVGLDGVLSFDVRIPGAIPEPATGSLAALASTLLLLHRRRS